MKFLKFSVVLALIAAVTCSAGAVTFLQPFQGPVKFKLSSWDMQSVYNTTSITPNTVYNSVSTLNGLSQSPAPGAVTIPSGPYAGQKEDGWGVVQVTEIRSDDGLNTLLWSSATSNTEIVGLFYGNVDNGLYVDSTTQQQTIQSDGEAFRLYEQPKGTFNPGLGSSGRTAFTTYNTVGTDALGNPLPGATLLLSATATAGVTPLAGTTGSATSLTQFTTTGANTGYGKENVFLAADGGAWANLFVPGAFAASPDGSLFMQSTLFAVDSQPTANFDWTTTNDDPMRGVITSPSAVPEPLSMLLITSATGGLWGYLRKRRMA